MLKIVSNQQNLKYTVDIFHGGEVNFRFENDLTQRGIKDVTIQAQLRSSDDVMTLIMATDALRQFGVEDIHLEMPYVPYGRQDRICNTGEAHSLRVFARLIESQDYKTITIFDPHSDVQSGLLNAKIKDNFDFLSDAYHKIPHSTIEGTTMFPMLIAPDAGATKRVAKIADRLNRDFAQALKHRHPETREVTGINIYGNVSGRNCVVVDDILSGGATAIGIAEALKREGANSLYLVISHVEGEYGLRRVLEHYENVFVTNSMGELPQIEGVDVYDLFKTNDE